jgi:penicillin-binding protein 1C
LTPGASAPDGRAGTPQAAFLVGDILSDREGRAATFGLDSPLATRFWTAVKTGTSKDMRDNWCVGYSRRYTVGVWVGNFSGLPMWNVSGVSGAAPAWLEIMNYLSEGEPDAPPRPPPGLARRRVSFPDGSAREEWFLRGTEPAAEPVAAASPRPRLSSPVSGTIIALDPDIPAGQQSVPLTAEAGAGLRLALNGRDLGPADRSVDWTPEPGLWTLALLDGAGRAVDRATFEVRGALEAQADEAEPDDDSGLEQLDEAL